MTAIAPVLAISVATRVQARRVELATAAAKAYIDGNTVIVNSDSIKNPVAVRYGWAANPGDVNLYNKEGLPASPFRTDN